MTIFDSLTIHDLVLILATILAPLLAVQAQKYLERRREDKRRKLEIFKMLMTTRGARLSPLHVDALNLIDVEFYDKKYKRVTDVWRIYQDHLYDTSNESSETDNKIWSSRANDFFIDLLYEMGISLGYNFNKVDLKKTSYVPKAMNEIDNNIHVIRKALISILTGQHAIPMKVVEFPELEDSESQKQILESVTKLLEQENLTDGTNKQIDGSILEK